MKFRQSAAKSRCRNVKKSDPDLNPPEQGSDELRRKVQVVREIDLCPRQTGDILRAEQASLDQLARMISS